MTSDDDRAGRTWDETAVYTHLWIPEPGLTTIKPALCKNCKHWAASQIAPQKRFSDGICTHHKMLDMVMTADGDNGTVTTNHDFGCVLFEQK